MDPLKSADFKGSKAVKPWEPWGGMGPWSHGAMRAEAAEKADENGSRPLRRGRSHGASMAVEGERHGAMRPWGGKEGQRPSEKADALRSEVGRDGRPWGHGTIPSHGAPWSGKGGGGGKGGKGGGGGEGGEGGHALGPFKVS